VRRLYIFTALGVGLLATALISVATFSPETLNNILDPDRIEVVNVRWGNQISETERWINFTIHNHGEDTTSSEDGPIFKLEGYFQIEKWQIIDERRWCLQHGQNEIIMMGRTTVSKYRLNVDDETIWEETI